MAHANKQPAYNRAKYSNIQPGSPVDTPAKKCLSLADLFKMVVNGGGLIDGGDNGDGGNYCNPCGNSAPGCDSSSARSISQKPVGLFIDTGDSSPKPASKGLYPPSSYSQPSSDLQAIPNCQFAPLIYDPSGVGYVRNFPVQLTVPFRRVFKLGSGGNNARLVNNIYLHFTPLNFDPLAPTSSVYMVCGATPNCWPLEMVQVANKFSWEFCNGLPSVVFLSTDYQGDGAHTDLICFTNAITEMDAVRV